MRLTEAQARKLGLSLPEAAEKGKRPSRAKGRDRMPRAGVAGEGITFSVSLPHDPRPKARPRTVTSVEGLKGAFLASRGNLETFMRMAAGRSSKTFTPKSTADYERLVADAAREAMGRRPPLSCPVETDIALVLEGDEGVWPTSRLDGDADNLEKAVLDALNGIVFEDDRLVVRSRREKRCGKEPMVIVSVVPAKTA